jgi:hypothetical protein
MDFLTFLGIFGTVIVVPFVIYQTYIAHKSYKKDQESKSLKNLESQLSETRNSELKIHEKEEIKSEKIIHDDKPYKEPNLPNIIHSFEEHNIEMLNVRYHEKYS